MRSRIFLLMFLVFMFVASACATQALTEVSPTATPEPKTLTVLAAASLTESFTELGAMFEAQNPGVTVEFNFAGSQQLAEQLGQGAPADVFASASKKYMTVAVDAKRVNAGESKVFVQNKLVLVYPKENPAGLAELKDLSKAGIKLVLADKAVPVGQYSFDVLDKASADAAFGASFEQDVLKNVVSYEDNVKAVLSKVVLGEADAGVVYLTDITAGSADKVGKIDIADSFNTIASYPIAPVMDAANPELGRAFVALVLSAEGQAVLAKYGFLPAVK